MLMGQKKRKVDNNRLGLLILRDDFIDLVRSHMGMERIIDHDIWTKAAIGKAFDKFDAPFAVWTDSNGIVVREGTTINREFLAKNISKFFSPSHTTSECLTNANVEFSRANLTKAGIKCYNSEDMNGG